MPHQRIIPLRFSGDPDWDRACARLEACTLGDPTRELQLVRVDDETGVLIVGAAELDELAGFCAAIVEPWLVEQGLVALPSTVQGETILRHDARAQGEWSRFDVMPDAERVAYFARCVVASGTLWGLRATTWARSSAAGELEALPLWPDAALAARCIDRPWHQFVPRSIELTAFLEQWLTGMEEDGIVAVVLPTPSHPGAIVAPTDLVQALRSAAASQSST